MQGIRTRNWATVVYPESAPDKWKEILQDTHVTAFISPLHDADVNPDGTPKKAHYHVLLAFDGPKTPEQADRIFKKIGGVGREKVSSLRGYARYLCHLDNPEKHQYDMAAVVLINGADYKSAISLPTDKYNAIREMIAYCSANQIYSYADLLCYAAEHREDWFRVLCDSGTLVMTTYLKSLQWGLAQTQANTRK